jgi:hypothetical protein
MTQSWRDLRVGNQVRVISWPEALHVDRLHSATRDLYQWLIGTGDILTIVESDEYSVPYGHLIRRVDGVEQYECVALNHSGRETIPFGDDRK